MHVHNETIFHALAAVAVTSTAFAQDVTISGRLDMGSVSSKTTYKNNNVFDGEEKSSTLAGANGTKTGSRITFAGTEDLGGGLTAFFNIESSLNNSVIGNRNLFAGVRSDAMGSVQLGRSLNTLSAIRDAHVSIAGAPGGAFLNQHLNVVGSSWLDNEGVGNLLGFTPQTVPAETFGFVTIQGTRTPVISTALAGANDLTAFDWDAISGALGSIEVLDDSGAYDDVLSTFTAADMEELFGIDVTEYDTSDADELAELQEAASAAANALSGSFQTAAQRTAALRAFNAAAAAELRVLMHNGIANRSNNTLSYTTPNMNGFTATVGFSSDQLQARDEDRVVQAQAKTSGQLLSLAYASGPLSARLTLGSGKAKMQSAAVDPTAYNGATDALGESRSKTSDQALMVSYDLGFAKPYIQYNETKATLQMFRGQNIDGTNVKTSATEFGATFPMGSFEPFVTVGSGDIKTNAGGDATGRFDTSAYQIGTNYNLSKRTSLYFAMGQDKLKTTGEFAGFERKAKGYTVGLVHNF